MLFNLLLPLKRLVEKRQSAETFKSSRQCFVRCARLFRAGYAPAGQLLFLACPSKSNQKERYPAYRPQQRTLGVPCVARHAVRLRQTIFRARMGTESRSPLVGNSRYALRQSLPTSPSMAVLLGGAQGPRN